MNQKKIPAGITSFYEMITGNYLYCDKTLMIRDFLDRGEKVTLITRPRRWGKTLNMSMLHHFLGSEVDGRTTAGLFNGLEISKISNGDYMQYQGRSPVIFLSFKEVRTKNIAEAYHQINKLMMDLYQGFESILLSSNKLSSAFQKPFHNILSGLANRAQLTGSLKFLSECLYKYYGKRVYILIDDYDMPFRVTNDAAYLKEMDSFLNILFSESLANNPYLERAILTGVMPIANSHHSLGLNHLHRCTLLDEHYKSYFGLTEFEIENLFQGCQLELKTEEMKRWCNGYVVGDFGRETIRLYNSSAVIEYLNGSRNAETYGGHISNNHLIQKAIFKIRSRVDKLLTQLHAGETVEILLNPYIQLGALERNEAVFWNLLLSFGYLTAESAQLNEWGIYQRCRLRIPNENMGSLFEQYVQLH